MVAGMRVFHESADLETQVVEAVRERQYLDFGASGRRDAIDAALIRHVLISRREELDPFGLRLANAQILGELDLRATAVSVPLHFVGCSFDQAVSVEGAELHDLVISDGLSLDLSLAKRFDSSVPGLLANGVRIRRDLNLSGTLITGHYSTPASTSRTSAIWLTEADVGGRLLCFGTKIQTSGDRAIQADRTRIAGDVRLIRGFESNAEVRLLATQLGGSLDLAAASMFPKDGRALDIAEASIGGSLFILSDRSTGIRPTIRGRLELGRTTVYGRVLIRDADLDAPNVGEGRHDYNVTDAHTRPLMLAPRLTVHGEFVIEGTSVLSGGIVLDGADLKGGISLDDEIQVANPAAVALSLSNASLGSGLKGGGCTIQGSLKLSNAHIAGSLDLHKAQLSDPLDHRAVDAVGITVNGDVRLEGITVDGGSLNFRSAAITGVVDAEQATINNPGGKTLSLHQARVGGNVLLDRGFESVGMLVLNRAIVEGRLNCAGARLLWKDGPATDPGMPGKTALEAISATFRSGVGLGLDKVAGAIDLVDARASYLADNPTTDWTGGARLTGFTYRRFAPLSPGTDADCWNLDRRISWLTNVARNDPSPWEEAAKAFRAQGNQTGAERLLIIQRRLMRKTQIGPVGRLRRAWSAVFDWTVGYGYRPGRALFVLLALVAAVAITLVPGDWNASMRTTDEAGTVYSPQGVLGATSPAESTAMPGPDATSQQAAASCGSGKVRCFNPYLYAVDTVVPIINLGQRSTWYPSRDDGGGWLEIWLNVATVLGWTASTIFALSFTRLGRGSSPPSS